MIAATRAMAIELAPCGVRVNAINPVAGDTPLLATFMGGDTPEDVRAHRLDHPDRPPLDPGRHRRGGGLPVLGRRGPDHRRGAWRSTAAGAFEDAWMTLLPTEATCWRR